MNTSPQLPVRALRRRQQGMALLISLVVLVVVSLLGIVSMKTAMFQNRVSINNQIATQSFQAAESGLAVTKNEARRLSTRGPDNVLNNGDEILTSNPLHFYAQAINFPEAPRRICATATGLPQIVDNQGVRNADRSITFLAPCPVLANGTSRVTTVVSESPEGAGLQEGEQIDSDSTRVIQIRAEGDIPNTNIRSIHVEEWFRRGA